MRKVKNMKAKKSLGQNFLKSKKALSTIVESAGVVPYEWVLEIGPGRGALTEPLLKAGARVVAVETDGELIWYLEEKFKNEIKDKKLFLIHQKIEDFFVEQSVIGKEKYKIVANIPYYITGEILRTFLGAKNKPTKMVLLVQKEVADRIVCKDSKESILSISVACFGKAKKIMNVKARDFSPMPKVDSAILCINDISNDFFESVLEENFFAVVKEGFSYKRKVLTNNFEKERKEKILEYLKSKKYPPTIRAEKLKLSDWRDLTAIFSLE